MKINDIFKSLYIINKFTEELKKDISASFRTDLIDIYFNDDIIRVHFYDEYVKMGPASVVSMNLIIKKCFLKFDVDNIDIKGDYAIDKDKKYFYFGEILNKF